MTTLKLESVLQSLPHSRPCLISKGSHITIGEVLIQARSWRDSLPDVKGACFALCGLEPKELITALIALDGYAAQILLLPSSIDSDTRARLIEQAGTTHTISTSEKKCQQIKSVDATLENLAKCIWILTTSGTTGTPKLIEHNLATLTRTIRVDPERGEQFVWGLLYDPNRFAGLQVVLQALYCGSPLAIPLHVQFDEQLNVILTQKVNALSATPTLWRKLLIDGRVSKLPLRQLTLGGEMADQAILDALKRLFPESRIIHIYASTEAGTGFSVHDGRAGFPAVWLNNPSHHPTLSVSSENHLLINPAILPKGPEVIARLDINGYLDTQDLIQIDNDRVFFMGRASGAINVGGNKAHPEQIENYLRSIYGVADARVYAKKNSIVGELVAAEIVLHADADLKVMRQKINQLCRINLASWEAPAFITFTTDLKINAAGKAIRI